ncbi:MAG: cytidylate kinase-like family protein [Clostridia bacterium]|nr:cytidylate kinase-like family protein [Clostridia bacterium]
MIICISREYGSGGGEIGHRLADYLGIPCYDKTVTALTADISGFTKELVARSEDKTPLPFDYSGYYYFYDGSSEKSLPIYDQIFLAQSRAILRLAEKGDCVIVGRCAAHVLEDKNVPCISVFIHAPMEERVKRVMERQNLDEKSATKAIRKNDKARANYYRKYASAEWGKVQNYEVTISSAVGIDNCVKFLADFAKMT